MTEAINRKKKSRTLTSPQPVRRLNLWLDSASDREVRIEIIPLIDVIFCILTFFILAAVGFSRQQAINLNLPKATTGAPQLREMLIVSIDYSGQVYVEQQPVAENQLSEAVQNYFLSRPNGMMVLYASKDVNYDRVVRVLDTLREVGGDRVALATLPEGQSQPSPTTPLPGAGTPNFNPASPNNDPLDSFGAPPIPDNSFESPVVPQQSPTPSNPTPQQSPAQPNLPTTPGQDVAPATPNLPPVPSE
ncbi:biopolymer transporter ExbD [Lusitaniella coriacea]|uniref:ExbD/TolR family protein n=1 Tax=Lusitaniella coriacea TaxID=1983105 RepID=UPI003CEDFF17